jgi:hypothetical protein
MLWLFNSNKHFVVKFFACSICFVTGLGAFYVAYRSSSLNSLVAISSRLDWHSNTGDERRINMLRNAMGALRERKVQIFGTGLSAFYPYVLNKRLFVGYQFYYDKNSTDSIHNVFGLIALECGLPVFALFVIICFRAWLFSWRVWKRLKGTKQAYVGLYLLSMSTAFPIPMMLYNSVLSYQMLPFLTVYLCLVIHSYERMRIEPVNFLCGSTQ